MIPSRCQVLRAGTAGLLLATVLACSGASSAPGQQHANVLLIVVDTLRKDALGCYGYGEFPTSPELDVFAGECLRFDDVIATTSWTLPSMATLFTGLSPAEHGVMRLVGEGAKLTRGTTLAEELHEAGYATGAVVANFLLARRFQNGFDRGFDFYDDAPANRQDPHRGSTAAEVADRGLAWLAEQDGKARPWLLSLHFFDPHASYEDHPEWEFSDAEYEGWVEGGLPNDVYREHQETATEADRRQLRAYYAEEVRAVDAAFGRILAALRARSDWQDTVVVFTADHGEELAERGLIGHTRTLHSEQIDLPLLVRAPEERIPAHLDPRALLAQSAIPGLILEMAGVRASQSRGSAPVTTVAAEVDFVPIRTEHPEKFTRKRAVIRGGEYKLVHDLQTDTYSLYDLAGDPGETSNLIGRAEHAAVEAELRDWMARHRWWEGE